MPRISILDRFRPVGAPGAAGSVGVPARDRLGPADELAPVFAALHADLEHADATATEASEAADAALRAARAAGVATVAAAQEQAGAARASAADRILAETAGEDARRLAQSQQEADAEERRSLERMPHLVERAKAELLAGVE